MNKTREWWIKEIYLHKNSRPEGFECDQVHVIDYSAHEYVLAERDRYKQMWQELAQKISHPVDVPMERGNK